MAREREGMRTLVSDGTRTWHVYEHVYPSCHLIDLGHGTCATRHTHSAGQNDSGAWHICMPQHHVAMLGYNICEYVCPCHPIMVLGHGTHVNTHAMSLLDGMGM